MREKIGRVERTAEGRETYDCILVRCTMQAAAAGFCAC